ncbi:MAG TPA: signal peptidase I, partial [Solirubrobacteraceae bacterium]|nr:signal peptidase I [Solirubrobacteraceae bacterium]
MRRKEKTAGSSLVELVVIVAVALGLALGIQAFLVKPYRIPSLSMYPTLDIHQRVLVNRLGNNFGDPSVGDIVVFNPPEGANNDQCGDTALAAGRLCPRPTEDKADVNFIKRVVGTPGDRIRVREGKVILNGKPLDESYAQPCNSSGTPCNYSGEITIPPDH